MTITVSGLRAESKRLRAQDWSYRRIARELQRVHHLNARVAFRLAHGWTQDEAARRWNERWSGEGPPKTNKSFSYWESWPARGGRAPSPRTLQRLAELYLCRPGDLLDGEDFGARDTGSDESPAPGPVGSGSAVGAGGSAPGMAVAVAVEADTAIPGAGPAAAEDAEPDGTRPWLTRADAMRVHRRLVALCLSEQPAA